MTTERSFDRTAPAGADETAFDWDRYARLTAHMPDDPAALAAALAAMGEDPEAWADSERLAPPAPGAPA